MKFIYSLTGLAVLAVVASSLVVHDRDSTADVKKREIHEVEREVVKREVTDEDVSNVCPNCSVGFVCCPGVNVSTCCQQVMDVNLFIYLLHFHCAVFNMFKNHSMAPGKTATLVNSKV